MTAEIGDFVTPGSSVIIPDGSEVGEGIHTDSSGSVAVVAGTLVHSDGEISVDSSRPSVNSPQMVISSLPRSTESIQRPLRSEYFTSKIRKGGHRDVPAESCSRTSMSLILSIASYLLQAMQCARETSFVPASLN